MVQSMAHGSHITRISHLYIHTQYHNMLLIVMYQSRHPIMIHGLHIIMVLA